MLNEKIEIGIYLFFNLLSLYTIDTAISVFFNRKKVANKIFIMLPYALYFIIGVVTYLWNQSSIVNTLLGIILLLVVQINFQASLKNKVTFTFSWAVFKIIIELVISNIYCMFLGLDLTTMLSDDVLRLIGNAYIVLITLLIVKASQLMLKKIKDSEKITYIDSFQITVIPICSIAILYTFIDMSVNYNINNWQIIFSILLIVFMNIFFFYLFDRVKDSEKLKYDNVLLKQQAEYYINIEENVNSTFDRVRVIKHDLKHQLLYLKMKTDENTIEALYEVRNKLESIIGEILVDDFQEYTKNKKLNCSSQAKWYH